MKVRVNLNNSIESKKFAYDTWSSFILNSIEFLTNFSKVNSITFPCQFFFKCFSEMLQIIKDNTYENGPLLKDNHVVKSLSSEKILNMIFKFLWDNSFGEEYLYEVSSFQIILYFINKLLKLESKKVQNILYILFTSRERSQQFFDKFNHFLTSYTDKLNQAVGLYYSDTILTKKKSEGRKQAYEHTKKLCYYADENLENQVLTFISLIWSEQNQEMKNYIRIQTNSRDSYNFVRVWINYMKASLPYIQYTDAFNAFISSISAIFESIDGQNIENIKILLEEDFFKIANSLLSLVYYLDDDDIVTNIVKNFDSIK